MGGKSTLGGDDPWHAFRDDFVPGQKLKNRNHPRKTKRSRRKRSIYRKFKQLMQSKRR